MEIFEILSDQQKAMLALVDVRTFCDPNTDIDFGRSEIIRFFAECPYGTDFDIDFYKSMAFINENVSLEIRFVIRMTLGMQVDHIARDKMIDDAKKHHSMSDLISWTTSFNKIVTDMGYPPVLRSAKRKAFTTDAITWLRD